MSAAHQTEPRSLPRNVRVIATRARRDAERLYSLLEDSGAQVLECPTVTIEPPESFEPLDAALERLAEYHWIAFTSRNAVVAVDDRLAHHGVAGLPKSLRVAAVGPSTARELEERGVQVDCIPATASAAALAELLAAHGVQGAQVLLPLGDLARPELERRLTGVGAHVDTVIVYRTLSAEAAAPAVDALKSGDADFVALASPSAFRNLVAMLGADDGYLERTSLACIGPTTASAVREMGFEPAVIASEATLEGLARSIIARALEGGEHD